MPKPTLYIAGPMTGIPDFNYPAFHAAAAVLRAAGFPVLNPAELPDAEPRNPALSAPEWSDWLRAALHLVVDADAVALLPGWWTSKGVALELDVSRRLGMVDRELDSWLP